MRLFLNFLPEQLRQFGVLINWTWHSIDVPLDHRLEFVHRDLTISGDVAESEHIIQQIVADIEPQIEMKQSISNLGNRDVARLGTVQQIEGGFDILFTEIVEDDLLWILFLQLLDESSQFVSAQIHRGTVIVVLDGQIRVVLDQHRQDISSEIGVSGLDDVMGGSAPVAVGCGVDVDS